MGGWLLVDVLGSDLMQHCYSSVAVVKAGTLIDPCGLCHFSDCECWNVARALRDCSHQPDARLRAVGLGYVLPNDLGLGYLRRHHRSVRKSDVPLHSRLARDIDFRDA